jgi:hypothetical protein
MHAELASLGPGRIGILTKAVPERVAFAGDLISVFKDAGWEVISRSDVLWPADHDRPGVLLIRHGQENTPDLGDLLRVLAVGGIDRRVETFGHPYDELQFLYRGDLSTEVPVLFVGPREAEQE